MPSLNPNRFRGVVWLVEVDDVRPNPSCDQRIAARPKRDPGQVADRVHGDLRIVGAGLDAEVTVGPGRVEVVGREVRQPSQRRGLPVGEPEPVLALASRNRPGPKPKVMVSPAGGRPIASPVSSGGASYGPEVGPTHRRRWPGVIRAAAVGPVLQQPDELVAGVGGDVEGGEVQPVLQPA